MALRQFICLNNQVQYIVCSLSIGAGVLLLNACLTVREKEPKSHSGKVSHYTYSECMEKLITDPQGWEKLTDAVIHWINDHISNVVFLLWGADAQRKASFINEVCTSI